MSKKPQKETIIRIIAIVATLLVFGAAVAAVIKMVTSKQAEPTGTSYTNPTSQNQTYTYNGKDYILKEDIETILLMGIDDYENDFIGANGKFINDSQADVLYVFVIDHKNKTYQTIQLNRDTMTNVSMLSDTGKDAGSAVMQLALAHAYGRDDRARCRNTVDAVSELLFDMDIDHFISLTLESIDVLNDQVGGVTVTIPKDMTAADPEFTQGATVTLKGSQAEKFVRSRMSLPDDTNEFRMERQQQFLTNWKIKAMEKLESDSNFGLSLVLSLSNYMESDMSANELSGFAGQLSDYEDKGVVTTKGTTTEGELFREYKIDLDDLEGKVVDIFYDEVTN